jgi:hypothetical protein
MSPQFKPFPCGECGRTVRMLPAKGEVREFRRGVRVPVPASVLLPTCEGCGETYLSETDSARVDAAVREVFLEGQRALYARCVGALQREHGATLREIEKICAVTPTYFSHVMKGRRVASLTLTRLLEAFVACPAEFERHREGAPRAEGAAVRRGLRGSVAWTGSSVPARAAGVFRSAAPWPDVPGAMQGSA